MSTDEKQYCFVHTQHEYLAAYRSFCASKSYTIISEIPCTQKEGCFVLHTDQVFHSWAFIHYLKTYQQEDKA